LVLSGEATGPEYEIRVIQAPKWKPYKYASKEAKERRNAGRTASKAVAQFAEDTSSEATTKSLTEFTCFSKLPPGMYRLVEEGLFCITNIIQNYDS